VKPRIIQSILMLAAVATFAAAPDLASAQSNKAEPEVWKLTIYPQAPTLPALRYALLTSVAEQTPGNAASIYLLAFARTEQVEAHPATPEELKRKGLPEPEEEDLLHYFDGQLTLEQLPPQDVEILLSSFSTALQGLDTAARRDYCRWELPTREFGYETLLPHLNPARHLAYAAVLQARLHVKRHEYDAAAHSLSNVFQMSQALGEEGVLVQSLVGTGIAALAVHHVREFVQQPDAPNLYWPIASLPRPFVAQRSALEWERAALMGTFPQLRRAETDSFSATDWAELVNKASHLAGQMGGAHGMTPTISQTLAPAAAGAILYPQAKRYLAENHVIVSAERLNAMTVPQVLGRYVLEQYRRWFDEMEKWTALPFWQAYPRMVRAEQAFAAESAGPVTGPLKSAVPAVSRAAYQFARLDRQVAALQTVEAIRAYAAAHDGKLPDSLEALDAGEMPAATDPTTGKAFVYHANGDTATLESVAPRGQSPRAAFRIELKLAK
jgi:hypothetical protein